jgi:hypothetical protein
VRPERALQPASNDIEPSIRNYAACTAFTCQGTVPRACCVMRTPLECRLFAKRCLELAKESESDFFVRTALTELAAEYYEEAKKLEEESRLSNAHLSDDR